LPNRSLTFSSMPNTVVPPPDPGFTPPPKLVFQAKEARPAETIRFVFTLQSKYIPRYQMTRDRDRDKGTVSVVAGRFRPSVRDPDGIGLNATKNSPRRVPKHGKDKQRREGFGGLAMHFCIPICCAEVQSLKFCEPWS